ncbi:MAG: RDD family protein [Chitinophagaceae bacterium]
MPTILEILNSKYTVFVGSASENDIVFSDPDTSPRHCQLSKVGDDNYLIVDLSSATGTFVNNKKIEKEFITEADFITVGGNIFQLSKKVVANSSDAKKETTTAPIPKPIKENSDPLKQSTTAGSTKSKITVYFLSAPEDENITKAIDKHLSNIRFNTNLPVEINGDYKIEAGTTINQYKQKLFEADIVLVFVSVDLLNNDECYERLKKVISNHNSQKTTLLPILARNCMWKATPFANLPLLPKNQQPLNNKQFWNSEDDALTEVVKDIYAAINDFAKPEGKEKIVKQGMPSKAILEIDWRKNYLWKVFWKRVAATLLDGLIIAFPLYLIFYALIFNSVQAQGGDFYDQSYAGMSEGTALTILFYFFMMVVAQILIYSYMESSSWRGTIGKRIMKLQITDNNGNPISFKKAMMRNIIKLLISAFSSIGNGIIVFIYLIAQVIAYSQTKKFFHDQLSNTVIGERLETSTQ